MNLDLTTTIQIAQITLLLVGGIVAIVLLRNTVKSLKEDFKAAIVTNEKQFVAAQVASEKQFAGVQTELKKLGEILIDQARFDEKLTSLDRRVTSQGQQLDELRHGEGFVRGRRVGSIDREFPGAG